MNCVWQKDLRSSTSSAAALLPSPTVDETGWDILLALYSDRECELSLRKLRSLVSAMPRALDQWLASLEERQLVTGKQNNFTGELRAVLSPAGRELLERYLSAADRLQTGARH